MFDPNPSKRKALWKVTLGELRKELCGDDGFRGKVKEYTNNTKSGLTTPFIERIISLDVIAFPSGEMVKKANLQPHLTSTELKTR